MEDPVAKQLEQPVFDEKLNKILNGNKEMKNKLNALIGIVEHDDFKKLIEIPERARIKIKSRSNSPISFNGKKLPKSPKNSTLQNEDNISPRIKVDKNEHNSEIECTADFGGETI